MVSARASRVLGAAGRVVPVGAHATDQALSALKTKPPSLHSRGKLRSDGGPSPANRDVCVTESTP